jgi:hypothetical protein
VCVSSVDAFWMGLVCELVVFLHRKEMEMDMRE